MPTVDDVLQAKGGQVYSVDPRWTVMKSVQLMNQHKIGAVAVVDGDRLAGIFTERDVLQRVVGQGLDPNQTPVSDVMSSPVVYCQPGADLDDVSSLMKNRRIRHLPVCDSEGRLLGMVSIGDVNATYAKSHEDQIAFLSDYIYGRV